MQINKAVRLAEKFNGMTRKHENVSYEAWCPEDKPEDGYVLQYYKGKFVGIAGY